MKRLFTLMLLVILPLGLFGCGGGGGGSDDSPVQTELAAKTLTTTVQLGGDAPAASLLRAVNYQSAVVTLTLPDGTSYSMSDNGNGDYSLTVDNFPENTPFIIEAHAGDVVLKNFFTNLAEAPDGDLGITDPKTTLYTDLIAVYIDALDVNQNFPTSQNLLSAVQGATLDIDFISLKEQVLDDVDTTYALVRDTYTTTLSVDNVDNNGISTQEILAGDTTVTQAITQIEQGGITPPIVEDPVTAPTVTDAEFAAEVVQTIFTAWFNADLATLSAGLGESADGFLQEGMNKEQWLAAMQTDEEYGLSLTTDAELNFPAAEATVKTGSNSNEFWVYLKGSFSYTNPDTGYASYEVFDDYFEGYSILVVKRADGSFVMMGDQRKVSDVNFEIGYVKQDEDISINYWGEVEVSDNYPVESVALTSTAFTGTAYLYNEPGDDSNDLSVFFEQENSSYGPSINFPYRDSNGNWTQGTPIGWTGSLAGATMIYTVNYVDGTVDTFELTLPGAVTPVYPTVTPVQNSDGTVTISWQDISANLPAGGTFSRQSVEVIDASNGWFYISEANDLDPSVASIVLPADILTPGTTYLIRANVFDVQLRSYQSIQSFSFN